MNRSLTVTALFASLLLVILQNSGIEITNVQVEHFIYVLAQIISLVLAWYGRYRAGDITWYGSKKPVQPTPQQ